MCDESGILDYLAKGGRLSAPDNAPPRYRAELLRIMASFVDSEMAGASGFADCINEGPGVVERIAAARIVLEKFDHARRVLRIMADFGVDAGRYERLHPWAARLPRDAVVGQARRTGDMRLNVFHSPIAGWTDAVAFNVLMGSATVIQLGELSHCSYQPLAEAFREILPRERRHAELGEEGLVKLAAEGEAVRGAIAESIDYWWPKVGATFGAAASGRADLLARFGLRHRANADLLDDWRARAGAIVGGLLATTGVRC